MLRTHILGRPIAVIGLPSSDSVPLELVKIRRIHHDLVAAPLGPVPVLIKLSRDMSALLPAVSLPWLGQVSMGSGRRNVEPGS